MKKHTAKKLRRRKEDGQNQIVCRLCKHWPAFTKQQEYERHCRRAHEKIKSSNNVLSYKESR